MNFHLFQFFRNGKGDYLIGMAFLMETTVPFISTRQILLTVSLPFTRITVNTHTALVRNWMMKLWPNTIFTCIHTSTI